MFGQTKFLGKKLKAERRFKDILSVLTFSLFLPTFFILLWLFIKGAPVLSMDFLMQDPIKGMTAGGIFPTIVGTFYLIILSLVVATPLGVMSAIYLSEYAPDNTLTRLIRLSILNLALPH